MVDPRLAADSPRIFENAVLEKLSRAHPRLPIILFGPVVAGLGWLALRDHAPAYVAAWAFAGYFLWTLMEYFGHRFVFHFVPPGTLGARLHFLIHGVHHEYPNDPWRLVMPPLLAIPVLAGAGGLIWLGFGPALFSPVTAGFVLGYIIYDTMHYELHHREPRSRPGRWLKRRHMLHHFRDATRGFGISCPWWDVVFGTSVQESGGTR